MSTLYDILELPSAATREDIRRSYRRLSKQFHPDVNDGAAWAESRFKEINHAYQILSNPVLRREYDRSIGVSSRRPYGAEKPDYHREAAPQYRNRRPRKPPPRRRSPYFGFFMLLAVTAILLLIRVWRIEHSQKRITDTAYNARQYEEVDLSQIRERLELLHLYRDHPQLFLSEDARRLSDATLPPGFAADLKHFLMEGDTMRFYRLIRTVVNRTDKKE